MMSFIDGMTAHMFRKDAETGRTVFFPHGAVGRGYLIPDNVAEQRVRRFMRWMMIIALAIPILGVQVLILMYGPPMDWPMSVTTGAIGVVAAFTLINYLAIRRLVSGFQPTEQRLTFSEAVRTQSRGLPRWYLKTMVVVGPLLMVGTIMVLANADTMMDRIWGLLGLLLFSFSTTQAVTGLRSPPDRSPKAQP
jgi:hypothetical protein